MRKSMNGIIRQSGDVDAIAEAETVELSQDSRRGSLQKGSEGSQVKLL